MAYRLERGELVTKGLKRVVSDEIESAREQLSRGKKTSRDTAIHEARKSIKKVRAVVRLVGDDLGDAAARENARLRDIGRSLSEFRDAAVMIASFDDLTKRYGNKTVKGLQTVRAGLVRKKSKEAEAEDVEIVLDYAVSALGKIAKRAARWPLERDGYRAIAPGLEQTYRAGRAALAHVRKNPSAAEYHELRKRVKDHWYHMRLLEGMWTDLMKTYEKSLKDLETWLGEDHNLIVLREKVLAEPEFYSTKNGIELLLDLIERYHKELREQSVAMAERIYEEKPREFRRRMKHLWNAWQHEPKALEKPSQAA